MSFPRIPSSSPISATIKFHSMAQVPKVTVSLVLPRHSSTRPSTEHSRPQYLVSSPSARPHFLQVRAARIDTLDPVSTRKLTLFPLIHPGRYTPFPNITVSSVAAPSWGPASIVTAATAHFQSIRRLCWSGTPLLSVLFGDMSGIPCPLSVASPFPGELPTVFAVPDLH